MRKLTKKRKEKREIEKNKIVKEVNNESKKAFLCRKENVGTLKTDAIKTSKPCYRDEG